MNRPVLFIDTCALSDKGFLKWLGGYSGRKKISAITYMGYLAGLIKNGKDDKYLNGLLRSLKIDVVYFTMDDAVQAANLISDRPIESRRCELCKQINWNDTIIASQGRRSMAWIVTENTNHFPSDPDYKVVSITETMNSLSDMSIGW